MRILSSSAVDPITLNLDPDPGFLPNLDPDPGPDPAPGQVIPVISILKDNIQNTVILEKNNFP